MSEEAQPANSLHPGASRETRGSQPPASLLGCFRSWNLGLGYGETLRLPELLSWRGP